MPRPGDWDAIGMPADPTPGDPDTIDQLATIFSNLGGKAREIYNAIETVMNTADDSVFSGATAEALRGKVDNRLRGHVEDVAWAFENSAAALRDWHAVVVDQQSHADAALAAGRGLAKDDPERQRQADLATRAGEYQAEQGQQISNRIESVSHISLPISACKIFWEAFQWLAIILIIPALVLGGPIALLALGVNLALFIKTAVDFANGDAQFLDLFLSGLGLIAPTTKALPIFNIIKGVGKAVLGGAKSFFQGFTTIFSRDFLLNRFLPGLLHLPALASVGLRDSGLWIVSGLTHLPAFAGGVFRTGAQFALNGMTRFPGLVSGLSGLIGRGFSYAGQALRTGAMATWKFLGENLGGTKWLRLLLPVDAGEIKTFGFWGALRIGVFDRGVLGQYRFGAPLTGTVGRTISAVPIHPPAPNQVIADGINHFSVPPSVQLGTLHLNNDVSTLTGQGFHAARQLDGLDGLNLADLTNVRAGDFGVSAVGATTVHPFGLHLPATAGTATPTFAADGLPASGLAGVPAAGVNGVPALGLAEVPGHSLPVAGTSIGDLLAPAVRTTTPGILVAPDVGARIGEHALHGLAANQVRLNLEELVNAPVVQHTVTGGALQPPTVDRVSAALQLIDSKPGQIAGIDATAGRLGDVQAAGAHAVPTPTRPQAGLPTTAPHTPGTAGADAPVLHSAAGPAGAGTDASVLHSGAGKARAVDAGMAGSANGTPLEPSVLPIGNSGLVAKQVGVPAPPPGLAHGNPMPGRWDVALTEIRDHPGLFVRVERQGSVVSHQLFNGGPNGRLDSLPGGGLRFTDGATGQTFRFDRAGGLIDEGTRLTGADGVLRLDDRILVREPGGSVHLTDLAGQTVTQQSTVRRLDGDGIRVIHDDGVSWRYDYNGRSLGTGTSLVDDRGLRGKVFVEGGDGGPLRLVDPNGKPLPGATVEKLPDGWLLVHSDGGAVRYTPHGFRDAGQTGTPTGPWAGVVRSPDSPGSGRPVAGTWDRELAAKADAFRSPGAPDAVVDARMKAWTIVEAAEADFTAAQGEVAVHGDRVDGPSHAPPVGEQVRFESAKAEQVLDQAMDSFQAEHGLDPQSEGQRLDDLVVASVEQRPRLLGGGPGVKTADLPGHSGVQVRVRGGEASVNGASNPNLFEVTTPPGQTVVKEFGKAGGQPLHTWTFRRAIGAPTLLEETVVLRGGAFDGLTVQLKGGSLGTFKSVLLKDAEGQLWPGQVHADSVTVASPGGPLVYDRAGTFHTRPDPITAGLPAPVRPPGLAGDAAVRWGAMIDLSRTHLTLAVDDPKVAALMRDVMGGSFTSKRGFGGFVNPTALADGTLVGKTEKFNQLTQDLVLKGPNQRVTVYRGVSMDPASAQADVFIERLPISTSNSIDFQTEWAVNGVASNRVVFEIDVPPTHGKLAMAYPPDYARGQADPPPLNQDQLEVTLAPTRLVRTGELRVENGLNIIPVRAEQIPASELEGIIRAQWPGMPSGQAFDDFTRALQTDSLRNFGGLEDVEAHSVLSPDGLVNTVTVSKPGYTEQLTITVTRDGNADSVTFHSSALDTPMSWSGPEFRYLASDLRGNVLHNNPAFETMELPESWYGPPPAAAADAPALTHLDPGTPSAGSVSQAWGQDLAARTEVFRGPGDSDLVVAARMQAWTRVQTAEANLKEAEEDFAAHGGRLDGPSDAPAVGDHVRLAFHDAQRLLAEVKNSFQVTHGLDPNQVAQRLDDLLRDSLKDRPRAPGGAPGGRLVVVPGHAEVKLQVQRGQGTLQGATSPDLFEVTMPERGQILVREFDVPGGQEVHSWTYKAGFGAPSQVEERLVLRGGSFEGQAVEMRNGVLGHFDAVVLRDADGHRWPARVEGDTITVASPDGPLLYDRTGQFRAPGRTVTAGLPAPVRPAGLVGDAATRWDAMVDVSRTHLALAVSDRSVADLMRDVKGGAFTSKRGYGGFVQPSALADSTLVGKVETFDSITRDLLLAGRNERLTVYRGVSLDPLSAQADEFLERLPISTSNSIQFQTDWAVNGVASNRVVFEIDVPADHGRLAMAYPPDYVRGHGDPLPLNQDQLEVTLAPTRLVRTGELRVENGLNIVPVRAEQIPSSALGEVVREQWTGLRSDVAFDDFARAFQTDTMRRFDGFHDAAVHSTVSPDGLVNTVTVSRPGSADELTITVTRDVEADSVAVQMSVDGVPRPARSWSGEGFRDLATDLRGNVLHNNDLFMSLPQPVSWSHATQPGSVADLWKGKAKAVSSGESTAEALDREFAAIEDVFRRPGDPDHLVDARMHAWTEVQVAADDLAAAQDGLVIHGARGDGPSTGPSVGEQAQRAVHDAQQNLDQARHAFQAEHGMDPDGITAQLDALRLDSLNERPRLLGGMDGLRRSGRVRVQANALENQRYWQQSYGPSAPFEGGTWVNVELGPGIRTPGVYGSPPGARENTATTILNDTRFANEYWKKGHLLNDNLGGLGLSDNLTPMSGTANARYQSQVERPLKDALDLGRRDAEFGHRLPNHWLGVEFSAIKVGQMFPHGTPAQRAIAHHLEIHSYWIVKPKYGGQTDFLTAQQQHDLGLFPLPNGNFDPLTGNFTPWTPGHGGPGPGRSSGSSGPAT